MKQLRRLALVDYTLRVLAMSAVALALGGLPVPDASR